MESPKTPSKKTAWSAAWGGTKLVALVMSSLLLLNSTAAYAGNGKNKLATDLNSANAGNVDVIVEYNTTPTSKHFSKAQRHGGKLKQDLSQMHAASFSMPANQVANLADDDSDITYISPDRPLQSTGYYGAVPGGGCRYRAELRLRRHGRHGGDD